METLVQKLEKMASVETWRITANDRETISQALELARADEHRIEREKRELENEQNALQQARAQMSSISEMVAALNCDYDRLEELRDEKKHYSAGFNMPGFMPDSDPCDFETLAEAVEYIAGEILESAERASEEAAMAQKNLESENGGYCDDGSTVDEAKEAVDAATRKAVLLHEQAVIIGQYEIELSVQLCDGLVYWVTQSNQFGLSDDDYAELLELESAAGNCENEDEARERIQIRSGWQPIGETLEAEEFTILLCTGGPAVRIVGELDQYKQPCRAWIEYQDCFTPWRELVDNVSHSDLLTYCQQFYFGE